MTRAGYTHIIVPKDLHAQLKALSQQRDVSKAHPGFIESRVLIPHSETAEIPPQKRAIS